MASRIAGKTKADAARRKRIREARSPDDFKSAEADKKQTAANRAKTLAETRRNYASADYDNVDLRTKGQTNPTYMSLDTSDLPGKTTLGKSKNRGGDTYNSGAVKPEDSSPPPSRRSNKSGITPAPNPDKNFDGKGLTKSLRPVLRKFGEGGDVEAPNAGIKALREQADGGNKNAKKALQNIGYKNGGCVMTKTNQSPKLY